MTQNSFFWGWNGPFFCGPNGFLTPRPECSEVGAVRGFYLQRQDYSASAARLGAAGCAELWTGPRPSGVWRGYHFSSRAARRLKLDVGNVGVLFIVQFAGSNRENLFFFQLFFLPLPLFSYFFSSLPPSFPFKIAFSFSSLILTFHRQWREKQNKLFKASI